MSKHLPQNSLNKTDSDGLNSNFPIIVERSSQPDSNVNVFRFNSNDMNINPIKTHAKQSDSTIIGSKLFDDNNSFDIKPTYNDISILYDDVEQNIHNNNNEYSQSYGDNDTNNEYTIHDINQIDSPKFPPINDKINNQKGNRSSIELKLNDNNNNNNDSNDLTAIGATLVNNKSNNSMQTVQYRDDSKSESHNTRALSEFTRTTRNNTFVEYETDTDDDIDLHDDDEGHHINNKPNATNVSSAAPTPPAAYMESPVIHTQLLVFILRV